MSLSNKLVARAFIIIFIFYSFWLILWNGKFFALTALLYGEWGEFFAGTLVPLILFYILLLIFRFFNRFSSKKIAFLGSFLTEIILVGVVWIFNFNFPFDEFSLHVVSILAFSVNLMQLISGFVADEEQNNRTKVLATGILLMPLVLFGALQIEDATDLMKSDFVRSMAGFLYK